jgi:hypothetical protein
MCIEQRDQLIEKIAQLFKKVAKTVAKIKSQNTQHQIHSFKTQNI